MEIENYTLFVKECKKIIKNNSPNNSVEKIDKLKLKDRDNFVLQMLLKMNVISIEQVNPLIRESLMQRNTNTSLSLKSSFDTSMPSASRSSTNPLYVHKL